MKKLIAISALLCLVWSYEGYAQSCTNCETLQCDGVNCDDGSAADGVQTSRNCSCGQEISGACAYVEFDLSLNPYFNPSDPTCKLIFRSQESGNFSIFFLDDLSCAVTDCSAPDFIVSSEATFDNIPSSGILRAIVCKNGGNAGRRDFTFSISCPSVENCVNNVDDNLDSWTDCEDPQCNTDQYCSYSETTSSNDGGLESNGRLSELIAKRNYLREKNSSAQNEKIYQRAFGQSRNYALRVEQEFTLQSLIATNFISNTETYISTPSDLIGMTNATDVMGVDIYQNENRVASVLGTESQNVYEHTKYICDRLNGAGIDKIVHYTIEGIPFIVTKFTNENGITEYNVNFSFYEITEGQVVIENHWNLADYPKNLNYFNYQVWANNIYNLEQVVRGILLELKNNKEIHTFHTGGLPDVFVKTVTYKNKNLQLVLHKTKDVSSLVLKGVYTKTEQDDERMFDYEIHNPSDTLNVDFENFYGIGITLYNDRSNVADAIYFADGSWGLDYKVGSAFINTFSINAEINNEAGSNDRLVERNIEIDAFVENDFAVYRAMNASYKPEDYSGFRSFQFEASGKGKLEVVFVKGNVTDWEKQPRKIVDLSEYYTRYQVDLTTLSHTLNDLKMIVFKVHNKTAQTIKTRVKVSHLRFSNEAPAISQNDSLKAFPNPARGYTSVQYHSDGMRNYKLTLMDLNGREVYIDGGSLNIGNNEIVIDNQFENGLYFLTLEVEGREKQQTKVIFRE